MSEPDRQPHAVRALLGRGSVYGSAAALQIGSVLLVLPAVTRLLSPPEFGVVAVALVAYSLLAVAGAAGLPETIPRTYFKSDSGPRDARALVATAGAFALSIALVAELTGPLWSEALFDLEYAAPLRIAVWSAAAYAVLITAQAVLRSEDRAGRFVATAIVGTAGAQGLGLAFLALGNAEPETYLAGVAVGIVLAAALAIGFAGVSARGLTDGALIRSTLRVSLPIVAHGLSLYLLWSGSRAVLSRSLGPEEAGRFHVAFLVGGLAILVVSAAYNAWAPIVFAAPDARRWEALADTTAALQRVAAVLAATSAVAAPLVLLILVPSAYDPRDLTPISGIVALSVVPFVAYCGGMHVLLWHGRTLVIAAATTLAALVNIGVNLALVPSLELYGSAIATLVAYSLQAALIRWQARGVASVPWRRRATVEAVVVTGVLCGLGAVAPTTGAWLVLRGVGVLGLAAWLVTLVLRLRRPGPESARPQGGAPGTRTTTAGAELYTRGE